MFNRLKAMFAVRVAFDLAMITPMAADPQNLADRDAMLS
jgi:hypothetical protein